MTVADFATKRVVATTMILVFMVFAGIFSILGMKKELMPDFNVPIVVVNSSWSGASAEDIKSQVSDKIETAVLNVDGIKNISTTSSFGSSVVVVEFNYGVDTDIKQVQIQSEVDKIKMSLPDDDNFGDPIISKIDVTGGSVAMLIGIDGAENSVITTFVEEILEPRLKRNKGIGNINIMGNETKEIKVELDPNILKMYNLSINDVISKVKFANTISPVGIIKDGSKEFILRVDGELKSIEDIENIIIVNQNNQNLILRDIAKIKYGNKERKSYVKYNGKDMIGVMIKKSKDGNLVEIAKNTKQILKELEPQLPQGAKYNIILDSSTKVLNGISNVTSTGVQALIISMIVLLIFLKDWRASIVVGMSIPISAIFTFFLLSTQGITLNLVSLMGLALAIGSLVDNAVVVLDNIFEHIQIKKEPPLIAAVHGTNEVIIPMIASTATSVVVFLPIVLFEGITKEIFKGIAFSMIFALSSSIIVAMLFVPMASSLFLDIKKISSNNEKSLRFNFIRDKYKILISKALQNRKKIIWGVVFSFIIVIFGLSKTVKTTFFPTIDNKEYSVIASLATGLDIEVSKNIAEKMEKIIKEDVDTKNTNVIISSDSAIINVDVKKNTMEAIERVRKKLKDIPNIDLTVSTEKAGGRSIGKDYSFQIEGENEEELNRIANFISGEMKKQKWFRDVKSSIEGGYSQAQIIINREKAESYGLNVTNLTGILAVGVNGSNPIDITQGIETLDVVIKFEEEYRNSLEKVLDIEIKVGDNKFVRIGDIAYLKQVESPASISIENGSRVVTISANLNKSKGFNDASNFINTKFKESNPDKGYKIAFSGNAEMQREMGGELIRAILLSAVLIYTVLAIQLESFLFPLILMLTLPLSMIGVIFGLAITRVQLSVFVMVGILMLFGMAVNNAIVLLDFVNSLREKGWELKEAIIEACGSRLRPILMTTLTTVLGWIPMAFAFGGGSAGYYQGMAIAVIFGLTFCMLLTLVFIPTIYLVIEEKREKKLNKFNRKEGM